MEQLETPFLRGSYGRDRQDKRRRRVSQPALVERVP